MSIVTPLPQRLYANPSHVVIRHFQIEDDARELSPSMRKRVERIVSMVQAMDSRSIAAELGLVYKDFETRHRQIEDFFNTRFHMIVKLLKLKEHAFSDNERALIGAYFSSEYSYQAAALMNPSIVKHPNQSDIDKGDVRFLMSLRAVGEGHISSITFREGVFKADGSIDLEDESSFSVGAEHQINADGTVTLQCEAGHNIRETVLFPVTEMQRNGLEDLRLVAFNDDDQETVYYGTYTAYSGSAIASEMLVTKDFHEFKMMSLSGSAARNKGMALFPRKINGSYAMIGRQDNVNIYLIYSDDLLNWNEGTHIAGPEYPWELMQIGNCGSPIELDEGWLLLTHGVGPMRQYGIGAMLLDKDDPSIVLGRSHVPLLSPNDAEREGYVPNVVYTCGAIIHNDMLFLPYGVADSAVSFATVSIANLLDTLKK